VAVVMDPSLNDESDLSVALCSKLLCGYATSARRSERGIP
jgi:hypothetical protein